MLHVKIAVTASAAGVERVTIAPAASFQLDCPRKYAFWFEAYAAGQSLPINFDINVKGTPFQKEVWEKLLTIPWGKTTTYGELIGRAPRAVGTAMGCNPIPLIYPCHRVVATNGLGGFAFGLEMKSLLIKHESLK